MNQAEITTAVEGDESDFDALGYRVVRGIIDPALVDYLWSYAHTKFAARLMVTGITRMATTPSSYGDPAFDGLLEHIRPRVEAATGLALLPSYSFLRLHAPRDVLTRHSDRPASEIVATLNIGQVPATPWPFHVDGANGPVRVDLLPGDAMVYRGHGREHWREPFEGQSAVQTALSYVDANGPHRRLKFDRRPSLMRPFAERQVSAGAKKDG